MISIDSRRGQRFAIDFPLVFPSLSLDGKDKCLTLPNCGLESSLRNEVIFSLLLAPCVRPDDASNLVQRDGSRDADSHVLHTVDTLTISLPVNDFMILTKHSSGILMVLLLSKWNAMGFDKPVDSDRLACKALLASSSAITRGNALANFFASSCCFVASVGRRAKSDCAINLGVVLLLLIFNDGSRELDESSVKSSDEIFRFALAGLLVLVDMVKKHLLTNFKFCFLLRKYTNTLQISDFQ